MVYYNNYLIDKMMKRKLFSLLFLTAFVASAVAQTVSVKWELGDVDKLSDVTMTGSEQYTSLLTTNFTQGAQLVKVTALSKSGADTGYTAVNYDPPFASFTPSTKVNSATAGHDLTFGIVPAAGHTLKITKISFDCVKVGTDGGAVDVNVKKGTATLQKLAPVNVLRNKIMSGNSVGYGHNEFDIADLVADDSGISLVFSIYGLNGTDTDTAEKVNSKSMGFRNIVVEGVMDEEVFDVSHYLSAFTCMAKTSSAAAEVTDLYNLVKALKNGESTRYATKLFAVPSDFTATMQMSVVDTHTADVTYDVSTNTANVSISKKNGGTEFVFSVIFSVTTRQPKDTPVALKRGLMALHSSGNLVSWRARKNDTRNYKFKLYRGDDATTQTTPLNSGKPIVGKTNYRDVSGTVNHYYRLEVLDDNGNVVEMDVSGPTWDSQTKYITLEGGAPIDPTSAGATYTPNDASYCDMDGDGEYEIVLKWAPSNEKDAASSGTTSPAFYSCYKMDGTRLWMLHTGPNMFNSAHTTPFVAWDLDGDGFGEFMVKTAPGAVDGEGNYVIMGDDDPKANWKNGRGKQTSGPEYITVFDGTTGAELKTIKYHTAYGDVPAKEFWGDENQNRSERYLAAIAWLDGENANPSAIFARGYYKGCRIGAYDWDGDNLTLRWLHSGESAKKGTVTYADGTVKDISTTVYGEGAHWMSIGDVTGDGKQEIHYGSGALNVDGTTLYRTGLEHGDALHLGDFIPSRPGQEFFMSLEHSPYGANMRDAKTGEVFWRITATDDTGRGIMAHFNPESEDAYWQTSIDLTKIYDTKQNLISTISHGGGASLNNRVFWNGTLADDYYDKSVLEAFNPSTLQFDRMQVNGTYYTIGTLNNSTKYNPCVLGDLLGDWREEIVTWTKTDGGDYQLIVNATNYETQYTLPHLMDDFAYRAQVISQNDGYNQPPHVSYDPRTEKSLVPATFEVNPDAMTIELPGKYWGSIYTTYPVIIPENVVAWSVTNYDVNVDTLKYKRLEAGDIIPANKAVVFNAADESPRFAPTTLASTANVSSSWLSGYYCDSLITDVNDFKFAYEFRNGSRGAGFYRTHGNVTVKGGSAFGFFGRTGYPGAESYVFGFQQTATGIDEHLTDGQRQLSGDAIYTLQGVRLSKEPKHGIYIKGGVKYSK
jgi:hypothetical protein